MDEQTLIKQAGQGDTEAFRQLVSAHQAEVYRQVLALTGDPEDAYDLTQETFVKAWHAISLFQFDCEFAQWISNIAQDTCKKYRKKSSTETDPQVEPPKQLVQAVMQSIRREQEAASPKAWLGRLKFTILAAIIAAIILLISRFGGGQAAQTEPQPTTPQPTTSQVAAEFHGAN
jgi:RNA polymerase sigma factor (sigma-70 family)